MDLKTISKWSVITGAIIIWTIKLVIRPYFHTDQPMTFFLGIAPNLLGSFLIPFGAYWFFNERYFFLGYICMISFGLLVFNEYLQMIPIFGRTFDYFDILFSAVGLSVSYFVFGRLYNKASAAVV